MLCLGVITKFTKLVRFMLLIRLFPNEFKELTNLVEVYVSIISDGSSTLPSSTINNN